ncbi:MAG: hypothetical protein AAF901_08825, partial [Bacteroidota bacterium]
KNFLNQFWLTNEKKPSETYGNYYETNFTGELEVGKYFRVELLLRESYRDSISKVFFLAPKEHYSVLKSDFSNYKEVEFDTIQSVVNDNIPNNETYKEEYWAKRSIVYNTGFAEEGKNYIRGILVERKDTSYVDENENMIKYIDRYLFVNKEVYIGKDAE